MQYFSNVDCCVILEVAIAHDVNAILRFAQLRSAAQPGPTRYHPPDSGCELHRGDFLTDFALHDSPEWDAWARDRREYYRRQALAALGTITQYQLDNGNIAAIASARRRIAIDVWEETAYQQIFLAWRAVVSASSDNSVRIWLANLGDLLAEAERLISRESLIFTPEEAHQFRLTE